MGLIRVGLSMAVCVLSGKAAGLVGVIKNDRQLEDLREIELWEGFRAEIVTGDMVRIEAGCDKRAKSCRLKIQQSFELSRFSGHSW